MLGRNGVHIVGIQGVDEVGGLLRLAYRLPRVVKDAMEFLQTANVDSDTFRFGLQNC